MRLIDADALKIRIQDGPAMMFVGDVLEMIDEAPEVEIVIEEVPDEAD